MSRRRGLSPDYPYPRRELACVAANCYSGSVARVLAARGLDVPEAVIWTVGRGHALESRIDKDGGELVAVDPVEIVARFCARTGLALTGRPFDRDRLQGGEVLWTDSRHLPYGDLFYGRRGYRHAVAVESVDRERGMVRLADLLVVSLPPRACLVDLPIDDLAAAAAGDLVEVTVGDGGFQMPSGDALTADLLAMCDAAIAAPLGRSVPERFAAACGRHAATLTGDALAGYLLRVCDEINTFSVAPSRRLLVAAVGLARGATAAGPLQAPYEALMQSWTILATLCLKVAKTRVVDDLSRLADRAATVATAERVFWHEARRILEQTTTRTHP